MNVELTPRTDERPRCSYCRTDLVPSAAVDECPDCRTTLHLGCRAELGRCPTVGCAAARGGGPQTRADQVPGARAWADLRRSLAEDAARPWPGVHRPRGPLALALALASGPLLGVVAGWLLAAVTSRPGHEAEEMWRFVPIGALLGALEGFAICALGVRKEARLRLRYPWWGAARRDAVPLVVGLVVAAALLGGLVSAVDHHSVRRVLIAFVTGLAPLPLVVLPLALRWLGWK